MPVAIAGCQSIPIFLLNSYISGSNPSFLSTPHIPIILLYFENISYVETNITMMNVIIKLSFFNYHFYSILGGRRCVLRCLSSIFCNCCDCFMLFAHLDLILLLNITLF